MKISEMAKLRRAFQFWKRFPDDKTAIDRLLNQYFTIGYYLRPKFNPEIDVVVESIVEVKGEKTITIFERLEGTNLLQEISDSLKEELLYFVLLGMVKSNIGRSILSNTHENIFELAWKISTFDYSFSSKHLKYSESVKLGKYIMGFSRDVSICVLPDDKDYYVVNKSKQGLIIQKNPLNTEIFKQPMNPKLTEKILF
ncbi:hypothetical protein KO465_02515 [Candidatus Micrarchaeota archaeon]|jgi:hypothetical protein|nr:hypothetical protein [Candidatus Micrarchaeota archaeon]